MTVDECLLCRVFLNLGGGDVAFFFEGDERDVEEFEGRKSGSETEGERALSAFGGSEQRFSPVELERVLFLRIGEWDC